MKIKSSGVKFPNYWWEWDCYNDKRSDTSVYSKDKMDEWFKLCVADFPAFVAGYNPAGAKAQRWFEKWFSRFLVNPFPSSKKVRKIMKRTVYASLETELVEEMEQIREEAGIPVSTQIELRLKGYKIVRLHPKTVEEKLESEDTDEVVEAIKEVGRIIRTGITRNSASTGELDE